MRWAGVRGLGPGAPEQPDSVNRKRQDEIHAGAVAQHRMRDRRQFPRRVENGPGLPYRDLELRHCTLLFRGTAVPRLSPTVPEIHGRVNPSTVPERAHIRCSGDTGFVPPVGL